MKKVAALLTALLAGLVFAQLAGAQSWSRYPSRRADCVRCGREFRYNGRYDGRRNWYPGGSTYFPYVDPYYRGYHRGGLYGLIGEGLYGAGDLAGRVIDGHYESEIVHDVQNTERQGMNTEVAQQALGQGYDDFDMNASPGHVGYRAGSGVPSGQQSLPPIVNFDEEERRRQYASTPPPAPAKTRVSGRQQATERIVAKLKKFRSEGLVGLVGGVSSDEENALNDAIIEMADPGRPFLRRGDLTDEAPLLRSLAKKAKDHPEAVAALHEAADYFEARGRG